MQDAESEHDEQDSGDEDSDEGAAGAVVDGVGAAEDGIGYRVGTGGAVRSHCPVESDAAVGQLTVVARPRADALAAVPAIAFATLLGERACHMRLSRVVDG